MISTTEKAGAILTRNIIKGVIAKALEEGQSISLWKTPGINEKHLIVCSAPETVNEFQLEEGHQGFAFAPFLPEEQKFLFPPEFHLRFVDDELTNNSDIDSKEYEKETNSAEINELKFHSSNSTTSFASNDFIDLVNRGIEVIESGVCEKLVPSRFKDIKVSGFDVITTFETLCNMHPNALVSLVSSPQTGTWLGASPEVLVSVNDQNKFKTIALAGTQPYNNDVNLKSVAWTQKEIEEQALVCRYIINCFKKIRLREYEEHGPRTVIAGNVMHLKTEYEVDMTATNFPQLGSVMLKLLHPTSAVCGMPFENALNFLRENEGYKREFYSGFLGPVQINHQSHIYVNLRCMQLFQDYVRLYAGAGVTIDSVAQKEFEETEMKMLNLQTLITQ